MYDAYERSDEPASGPSSDIQKVCLPPPSSSASSDREFYAPNSVVPRTDESPGLPTQARGSEKPPPLSGVLHDTIYDGSPEEHGHTLDGNVTNAREPESVHGIRVEMQQLIDLTAKYPEIGPPLAHLAFKIGQTDFGNQIVRMRIGKEGPGLEYYFVVANSARREQRFAEARAVSIEAAHAYLRAPDDELAPTDGPRLLHLIRLGYATLLFDEKNPKGDPTFVRHLRELLPSLAYKLSSDASFHALVAQTRWYDDVDASEAAWERAVALDDSDATWNSRGTWYKDAAGDLERAEFAYRKGLDIVPRSSLLLHNLGQLLVSKAERPDTDVNKAHRLLNEADRILRNALREESPRGLRRHVHSTVDRLVALRSSLPPAPGNREEEKQSPQREPTVGEILTGRVRSIAAFGAFIHTPECGVGLLHKSEIAHEDIEDSSLLLRVGEEISVKVIDVGRRNGKLRIGFSRKALLPPVEGAAPTTSKRPRSSKGPTSNQERNRDRDRGGNAQERSGNAQERSGNTQERSGNTQERSGNASERSGNTQERSGNTQERSGNAQERGENKERSKSGTRELVRPGSQRDRNRNRDQQEDEPSLASLGEMLLAKLKQQAKR